MGLGWCYKLRFFYMRKLLLIVSLIVLISCDQTPNTSMSSTGVVPKRNFPPEKLALGEQVYKTYCIRCHLEKGAGTADWRKRDANGKFPPPPLNGNGHTWHHSIRALKQQIHDGGIANGGSMPAMGDKLNEQEIESVILWIQSLWPEKIYNAWYEMQHQ